MTARHEQEALLWTRFSDYKIEDNVIRLAPGAMPSQYDPWAKYRSATRGFTVQPHGRGDRKGEAPYMALLGLRSVAEAFVSRYVQDQHAGLIGDERQPIELTADERRAVLAYVRANGLLGAFHHRVIQIGRISRHVWSQRGGQWFLDTSGLQPEPPTCLALPPLDSGAPEAVSYGTLAESFFGPEMPASVPHPLSPEFFLHYVEPVSEFLLAAYNFAGALDDCLEGNPVALDSLRCGAGTKLVLTRAARRNAGPQYEETPTYPALIDALADMVRRDLMGGFRLMRCWGCGALLRTNYHRTRYCSEQCRWKAIQRAHRNKAASRGANRRQK